MSSLPHADIAAEAYGRTLLGRFDRQYLGPRPVRVGLIVALAALLIIPSIQSARAIAKSQVSLFRDAGERRDTALGRWLPTLALVADGRPENPYGSGHWFPTPPFVLLCMSPLAKLDPVAAAAAWALLKVGGFFAAAVLLVGALRRRGVAVPAGVLAMAVAFGARPVVSDLQHANLNIFVAIWIALAWTAYILRRDWLAGLLTALAVVTKVTPALLLLYFLYKREWRVCLAAALGLVLVILVVPALAWGLPRCIELHRTWFEMLVAPYALHGYATLEIANQSLYGVLLRLSSNAGLLALSSMPLEQSMAIGMEDMARPATALGALLRPATSLAVLAALAWGCRSRNVPRDDPRALLELALVLLAMLLLGERTWKHHATTLPLVYVAVWYLLTCAAWTDRFRAWFVAGLAVQFALLVASSEGLLGDDLADRLLDGGFFCWGLLLAFIQSLILRKRSRAVALDGGAVSGRRSAATRR